jgi:hypothetical protein
MRDAARTPTTQRQRQRLSPHIIIIISSDSRGYPVQGTECLVRLYNDLD